MHPLKPSDAPAADAWTAAMRRADFEAAWQVADAVLQLSRPAWPAGTGRRHLQFG
jgi:hypothetical protein